MTTLDQVLSDVQAEGTLEDSLIALVQGIKSQLDAVLAGTELTPGQQAQVDAIFTAVETNKAKVASAVDANTNAG